VVGTLQFQRPMTKYRDNLSPIYHNNQEQFPASPRFAIFIPCPHPTYPSMAENPFIPTPSINREAIAQADKAIIGGATWFWWIAGLSLVNTVMVHSGGDISFVVGLGFTLIIDSLLQNHLPVALAIDALAIGIIFTLGLYARRGYRRAFITGIVLYTCDALIYLAAGDMLSLGFHAFALFFMIGGAMKLHAALKSAAVPPPAPTAPPVIPS
jgi:hypothetical protein